MTLPLERRRELSHRRQSLWTAAMIHRLSGIGLALFLPLHFLVLGLAIEGEARLDGFLRWTDHPLVKLGEAVLIALLVVHLLGGIRILVVETLGWYPGQRGLALIAFAIAAAAAGLFILRVM